MNVSLKSDRDVRRDVYPEDRRDLIRKLLQNQDRDSLLRLSVVLCNEELRGDGTSFLLLDPESNKLVLQESTVLTRFLGQVEKLDLVEEEPGAQEIRRLLGEHGQLPENLQRTVKLSQAEAWGPELFKSLDGFGLTRWALVFNCPLVIENIHEDVRWRGGKGRPPAGLTGGTHCELSQKEIGSIALTPIGGDSEYRYRGVLRVVRKKGRPGFGESELEWSKWLAGELDRYMDVAVSLTELMDLGTKLEVEDFGSSLVRLMQRVLGARGCSIFMELDAPIERVRTFSCIASTGVFDSSGKIDKKQAKYEVDMDEDEAEWLTSWVLRRGQLLALDSSHDYDPAEYPGVRQPGPGQYSETDPSEAEPPGGPILIAPLFLHRGREVAGAIRLTRPRGKSFKADEQLFFVDISRRLSSVLTNLRFRQASEKLIELYDQPDEMLQKVPREVLWLLGVDGCSVFRLYEGRYLRLKATAGAFKGREDEIQYDLKKPETHGWTSWVALNKRALLLNSPDEESQYDPSLKHSLLATCETGAPAHRFLAVPIFRSPEDHNSEVLGVIRAPRRKEDPPFKEEHQSILVSFAARLSLALNLTRRREQLGAVVGVSNPVELSDDPARFAREVVKQAVKVLIDEVGFEFAAIYKVNPRTHELDLRLGKSIRETTDPEKRQAFPYYTGQESGEGREITGWAETENEQQEAFPDLKLLRFVFPIRLGTHPLGTIEVGYDVNVKKHRISDRQKHLVRMVAGFCASALYNEIVFGKLGGIHQGLVRVGKKMVGDSPLKDKLQEIAEVAASVTLADNVIIFEYFGPAPEGGRAAGRFRESACGGPNTPNLWESTEFKSNAVPYRIVQRNQPIFAPVARKNQYIYHQKTGDNFIDREKISSAAALRLKAGDTVLGCIFFNYRSKLRFDAQKKQEIQLMAEYATIAIDQVRLLEEKSYLLRYTKHSLTQPLSTLLGYLENLASGIYRKKLTPADLQDEQSFRASNFARQAEQYQRLGQYMKYVVDAFLSIDRVETSLLRTGSSRSAIPELFHVDFQPDANLSELCELAVEVAEAYLMGRIQHEIQSGVCGDFDLNAIKTALLNVLDNAIKFGNRPGIAIRSGLIELRLFTFQRHGSEWVDIRVDDPGPGVPKSERTSIFERGYRRYDRHLGLGIGLFLTRGYVEAHGGKVWVEDSHLAGARFVVHLPLQQAKEGD